MTELCEKLLRCLTDVETISSSELSVRLECEAQKVVGAVKSLESLGGYINTKLVSQKRWDLTAEGREVMEGGSHEAIVFSNVPEEGIAQKLLMTNCGSTGKIGFSKAMSNGWIYIDKTEGGLVKRKVDNIVDLVKQNLSALHQGQPLEEALKTEYKKRKLVEEVTEKIYILSKGPDFSTSIKKVPTELTAEMIQSGSWKNTKFKSYNMESLGVEPSSGFLHPLMKVRAEYRQIFLEMGFTEMPTNNYVESSFWNFDALFQPQQHPARDAHDTFFISEPSSTKHFPSNYLERVKTVHSTGGYGSTGYGYDWKVEEAAKNLLRTHTTAVSARMLYGLANQAGGFQPQKYFSIDKVFRNETLDATHLAEFHQIEGVIADRGLTLGDLIGVLYQFFTKLGIEKLRFKPAYNPYTEPSMEIFSYHEGLGKWVEIGNSGVFRPEMLLPMGLPEDVNVIAWGLSLERPTMIKYGLNNIRDLVGHRVDLGMVRRNPLCRLDQSTDGVERQVNLLSKRFDKMLSRLEILQQRVNICAESSSVEISSCAQTASESPSSSLVVHCPVSRPPLSLEYVLPLLSQHCPLYISTHLHSSVSSSSPAALSLKTPSVGRSEARLRMTIIYTEVEQTTLIVTPGKQIQSEANLLRYLARSFPNSLYEELGLLHKIDQVLDSLATADSKHAVTKLLAAHLENQPFLAGEKLSIADYLGVSLARTYNISTPNIVKWINRC